MEAHKKEFWRAKYRNDCKKNWNNFYKRNETRFYKDRHWTEREFPILSTSNLSILEAGCGVGNFCLPILLSNKTCSIYAFDISDQAIELLKWKPEYDSTRMQAFQLDATKETVQSKFGNINIDLVSMIFVLSSVFPEDQLMFIKNVSEPLNLNGLLIFRDYADEDFAKNRFKADRLIDDLAVRQDGTITQFFSKGKIVEMFCNCGFEVVEIEIKTRSTVNIKQGLDVERKFIQAMFKKVRNA